MVMIDGISLFMTPRVYIRRWLPRAQPHLMRSSMSSVSQAAGVELVPDAQHEARLKHNGVSLPTLRKVETRMVQCESNINNNRAPTEDTQ